MFCFVDQACVWEKSLKKEWWGQFLETLARSSGATHWIEALHVTSSFTWPSKVGREFASLESFVTVGFFYTNEALKYLRDRYETAALWIRATHLPAIDMPLQVHASRTLPNLFS